MVANILSESSYDIALEPICAKCGEYFVVVPDTLMEFIEWKCGCRVKVLSAKQDYPIYDLLMTGPEKSLYLNGFVRFVRVQGFKYMEIAAKETAINIKKTVEEYKLSERQELLILQLKDLQKEFKV